MRLSDSGGGGQKDGIQLLMDMNIVDLFGSWKVGEVVF